MTPTPSLPPKKILVLDADCNAATCVVQSLGRKGHSIYLGGISERTYSFRSRYVLQSFQYPSPLENRGQFLNWFSELLEKETFDYILPLSDVTLYPLRSLSPKPLGLILPNEESFDWFFDKERTLELAVRSDVPIPRTRVVRPNEVIDTGEFKEFPYFVKLTRSKIWVGDHGFDLEARLVRNPRELSEAISSLTRYGSVLIQSYEEGEGVGIELLADRGQVLLAFAHQRIHEYPLTGGGSTYRVSIPLPPALFSGAERLIRQANWTGVAMVEFKKNGDCFSLMEVNGRFWGSLPLSYRSGVDFPQALIDLHEGRPVKDQPKYKIGLRSRRFSTDFSWFKRNLVADNTDPYTKTRPLLPTLLEYGGFLTGRDHWDHASFRDPWPVLSEIGRTLEKNVRDIASKGAGILVKKVDPFLSPARLLNLMKNQDFRKRPVRILVVCYGNICRSPFVEQLLRQILNPADFEVRSSGFVKKERRISPEEYVLEALEEGVDLSSHRSHVISKEEVSWSDLILVMDLRNWKDMRAFAPEAAKKILWLGRWGRNKIGEIPDPYGKSPEEMKRILSVMKESTLSFAESLSLMREGVDRKKRKKSIGPNANYKEHVSPGGG
jgi:protein-tyrosine-phosphatase